MHAAPRNWNCNCPSYRKLKSQPSAAGANPRGGNCSCMCSYALVPRQEQERFFWGIWICNQPAPLSALSKDKTYMLSGCACILKTTDRTCCYRDARALCPSRCLFRRQLCETHCTNLGAVFMGVQYSIECFCSADPDLVPNRHAGITPRSPKCDFPCAGNAVRATFTNDEHVLNLFIVRRGCVCW